MARISGVNISDQKHIVISLRDIYGIGPSRASDICRQANIKPSIKTRELSEDQISKLRDLVAQYNIEGDLRREVATNIRRLMEINCYRGRRHRSGLPLRGQRTRTNARTRKKSKGKGGKSKSK